MPTNITYNGKSLPNPLPLVSRDETAINYGAKWGTQYKYTLDGSLINCTGYDALVNQQAQILNIFNVDFKPLLISDDGVSENAPICFVNTIDFGTSDYLYNVPYTITLSTYPSDFFEVNGVLDPQDEWEFQESEDQKTNLTHTVSARGFNTSVNETNALKNAIGFVQQKTGLSSQPSTQFITGAGDFLLEFQSENIDRLNGVYSISERYSQDQTTAGMSKRYAVDIASGLQGFITVGINGSIDGGIDADLNDLRNEYHGFDIFSVASGIYTGATTNNDLNINPLSSGVSEDPYNKIVTFDIKYDNNPDPIVNVRYNVGVEEGETSTIVNVDGEVVGRGDLTNRWQEVQSYYYTGLDVFNLAKEGYYWHGGTYGVNPHPLSSGVTFDEYKGAASFRVSFDDRLQPPAYFSKFDYTVSYLPAFRQVRTFGLYAKTASWAAHGSSEHYFTDLGYYNKVEMSINGTATLENILPVESGVLLINNEIEKTFLFFGNRGSTQTKRDISFKPPFGQQFTFNYGWVFDGAPVNGTDDYGLILNLNTRR